MVGWVAEDSEGNKYNGYWKIGICIGGMKDGYDD